MRCADQPFTAVGNRGSYPVVLGRYIAEALLRSLVYAELLYYYGYSTPIVD